MLRVSQVVLSATLFTIFLGFFQEVMARDFYITCIEPTKTGLFEQCQEVSLIRKIGNQIQVYSKPSQKVLSVLTSALIHARSMDSGDIAKAGDLIVLASETLWNSSKPGFDSLCHLDSAQKGSLLKVSCGRYRGENIDRASAYRIESVNEKDIHF